MRVATVDGLITLFYDGSKELYNQDLDQEWRDHTRRWFNEDTTDIEALVLLSDECKSYLMERLSWQQIIIVDGVTKIPSHTFWKCINIKRVIFANNTDIRIEWNAFCHCKNLVFIKWSLTVKYNIGMDAFHGCNLSSVFIPPRCNIFHTAFSANKNLSILNVPQDAELGRYIIVETALVQAAPYDTTNYDRRDLNGRVVNENINQWLKNLNNENQFALHRECASFQPQKEVILAIIQEKGLKAFTEENSAGITPSRYLQENPYTDFDKSKLNRIDKLELFYIILYFYIILISDKSRLVH